MTVAEISAGACDILADPKLKASAAKGAACFGTAGWHSQVSVISIVHDVIRSKICTTALKSSVLFTCVRGNVLLDRLSHGCSSLSRTCFGCFVSHCIAEESPGSTDLYPAVSAKAGETGREKHCVRPTYCMVTDCVRVGTSLCVRVMDCMCFYQEIRA